MRPITALTADRSFHPLPAFASTARARHALCVVVGVLLGLAAAPSWGQVAGSVLNLSGPLFAVKADGVRQALSVGSAVTPGDTLVTEEKTYARVKFADGSEITLRPGTQFKIENYAFAQADPAKDNAVFSLFKGALRAVTGLVGKRGNQDAYRMSMPTATIGIRGTRFVAQFVPEPATALSLLNGSRVPYAMPLLASADLSWLESAPTLTDAPAAWQPWLLAAGGPIRQQTLAPENIPPGAYVVVIDGSVVMSNQGGQTPLGPGDTGYTPNSNVPPTILPQNPGIVVNPPPSFNQQPGGDGGQPGQQGNQPSAGQQQDGCEVR